ncbi:MAG TPA: TIGR02206 family membrane protein [Saprospiraceae bacterium]|nr:TIGR02206 family membrane protein [Saprospiraceae bacterium]
MAELNLLFGPSSGFQAYSAYHWIPISLWICLTVIWIAMTKNLNEQLKNKQALLFSIILSSAIILTMIAKIIMQKFDVATDLPFHLCNILALIYPIALKLNKSWFFGMLYYWVLAGTLQAIFTPDLKEMPPNFIYFRYWLVHCGLVSLLFFGLINLKWKVTFKNITHALLGANVYMIFSLIINFITNGNYFFTMRKPEAKSLMDYIGPWPWYLLTGQLVMLILFVLLYIPFYFINKKKYSIPS